MKAAAQLTDQRIKIHLWVKDRFHSNLWGWLECIVMTLLIIVAGYYISPNDPFMVQSGFPWTWIVPILLALRYGLGPAFLSVIIMVSWFWHYEYHPGINLALYKIYFLGGLITTMLCGEFSSQWQGRVRRSAQYSDYAEERLENLAKTYFVTRVSHDRLEQSLISKPVTLRSALEELRGLIATHQGRLEHEAAHRLLQILAQYCSLEQAAIFAVKAHHHLFSTDTKELLANTKDAFNQAKAAAANELHRFTHYSDNEHPPSKEATALGSNLHFLVEPVAHIGAKFTLLPNDVLLEKALENNLTSYYAVNEAGHVIHSEYLAAVPLHVGHHALAGVLLVKQMPFLSLQHNVLQVLTILTNYYTYQLTACHESRSVLEAFPDCPPEFAAELVKLMALKTNTNTSSSLAVVMVKPCPERTDIVQQLRRHVRGLDYFWHTARGETEILITLMPLCGPASIEGYITRTNQWLMELFKMQFDDGGPIFLHAVPLIGLDPVALLHHLLEPKASTANAV